MAYGKLELMQEMCDWLDEGNSLPSPCHRTSLYEKANPVAKAELDLPVYVAIANGWNDSLDVCATVESILGDEVNDYDVAYIAGRCYTNDVFGRGIAATRAFIDPARFDELCEDARLYW